MIPSFEEVQKEQRKKECGHKIQWRSYTDADKSRIRMAKKHTEFIFTAYVCRFCGFWHVGHTRYQHKMK
jgi:rubrerythrin